MNRTDRRQEDRIRELALRRGYRVSKSRQGLHMDNHGQYQLIDVNVNTVVMGERYNASLEMIEEYLKSESTG